MFANQEYTQKRKWTVHQAHLLGPQSRVICNMFISTFELLIKVWVKVMSFYSIYLLYLVYRKVLAWCVCFPSPAPLVTQKRHEVATVLFSFQFVILEQALEEGFGEKNAFSFWSYPSSPSNHRPFSSLFTRNRLQVKTSLNRDSLLPPPRHSTPVPPCNLPQ